MENDKELESKKDWGYKQLKFIELDDMDEIYRFFMETVMVKPISEVDRDTFIKVLTIFLYNRYLKAHKDILDNEVKSAQMYNHIQGVVFWTLHDRTEAARVKRVEDGIHLLSVLENRPEDFKENYDELHEAWLREVGLRNQIFSIVSYFNNMYGVKL